jgi:hypothetical protein
VDVVVKHRQEAKRLLFSSLSLSLGIGKKGGAMAIGKRGRRRLVVEIGTRQAEG